MTERNFLLCPCETAPNTGHGSITTVCTCIRTSAACRDAHRVLGGRRAGTGGCCGLDPATTPDQTSRTTPGGVGTKRSRSRETYPGDPRRQRRGASREREEHRARTQTARVAGVRGSRAGDGGGGVETSPWSSVGVGGFGSSVDVAGDRGVVVGHPTCRPGWTACHCGADAAVTVVDDGSAVTWSVVDHANPQRQHGFGDAHDGDDGGLVAADVVDRAAAADKQTHNNRTDHHQHHDRAPIGTGSVSAWGGVGSAARRVRGLTKKRPPSPLSSGSGGVGPGLLTLTWLGVPTAPGPIIGTRSHPNSGACPPKLGARRG
jgi:hypothetical protein